MTSSNTENRTPVIFIPHGGGPWHVVDGAMGDPVGYSRLSDWLHEIGKRYISQAKAILVISGHWEEHIPTINFGNDVPLLYDYYGFPKHTYNLSWSAKGDAVIAAEVEKVLKNSGFHVGKEYSRGYDHGVFVPLMVAAPNVQIPVIQLSLVDSLNAQTHISLGKALEPLRNMGILIIASGMTFHNMEGFFNKNERLVKLSDNFNTWLNNSVSTPGEDERNRLLENWASAPGAKESHPRSEHFIPLLVAAGAAGKSKGTCRFSEYLMGYKISGYIFED